MTVLPRMFQKSRADFLSPDPPSGEIRIALNSLREGKTSEAARQLKRAVCANELDQAWGDYAAARLQFAQNHLADAKAWAQRAAATALTVALRDKPVSSTIRLAAAALELEATCLRRQSHYDHAQRLHHAALEIRNEHGTPLEQVESLESLATCVEWSGDYQCAVDWLIQALEILQKHSSPAHQAAIQQRLANVLAVLGRHEEAVELATLAHQLLSQRMPGDYDAIVSGLHMARAIIWHTESLLTASPETAAQKLALAQAVLTRTRAELGAFQQVDPGVLRFCEEQLDFIRRLQQAASLG